jgi:hypothetical protein
METTIATSDAHPAGRQQRVQDGEKRERERPPGVHERRVARPALVEVERSL